MATTNHLGITLVEQSQAQKEVTVNQALTRLDSILNTGAISRSVSTPPGSPSSGDLYIVGASPTGAWSGQAGMLAYFDQTWQFITPNEGISLWVNDEDQTYTYNGSSWVATTFTVEVSSPTDGDMLVYSSSQWNNSKGIWDSVYIRNASDATKALGFYVGSATSGTYTTLLAAQTADRNVTLPDATTTLVGTDATQTLTNKSIVATQLTGTLQVGQFPALTGDVTTSAGSLSTSITTVTAYRNSSSGTDTV